ncbi:uncharacterized protein [Rutidosis leptorrhynchoides]|uniref:uncharacterized protein n=1 Tax=Rutidosis leptorrhynchoides TaxID=125765 RepID=UPI003A98D51E
MFDLNEVPTTKSSSMLDNIPTLFHPYISNIYNVIGDGNCGYRALAVSLGFDQEYYETIRQQMRDELRSRYIIYESILGPETEPLFQSLCFFGTPCPQEYWMKMPEAGVLIANMYGVIVHSLSISGCTTIFPFWNSPEEFQHHRVVTIAYLNVARHFVMVELQG